MYAVMVIDRAPEPRLNDNYWRPFVNKALQALIDSILLAAGNTELGSSSYTPIAPLVRSLPRGTHVVQLERERDAPIKSAHRPERNRHNQVL